MNSELNTLALSVRDRIAELAVLFAAGVELPDDVSRQALSTLTAVDRQLARLADAIADAGTADYAEPAASH